MALKIKNPLSAVRKKIPAGTKAFKASKGSKFVLFIGDEGAILVHITGNVVVSRQFVPDASPQSLEELKESLAKDTKAPLRMVVDTLDQSYVQQTLPPVSSLSVKKLMKRRLDRDFGNSDIKGALLIGREKSGRRDWNFMMIALEKSPQLTSWIDFVSEIPNRFLGIHLVAIESEIIVKNLERAIGVDQKTAKAEWKFFVSHNKVSGFRQVIMRNGRVVFTRLAQPLGDSNAEVLAGNIEQEILSTIEYMKRLSFTSSAGLDIYILASSEIRTLIDPAKFNASSLRVFTPYDVAEHLGIEGATQPTDQFGDVILASSIGCSRKHALTLYVPQFRRVDLYSNIIRSQRAIALLAVIGAIGYVGMLMFDVFSLARHKSALEERETSAQSNLNRLQEEIDRSHLDIEGAGDLIVLYQQLLDKKLSPLPFIEQLAPVAQSPVWIKEIEWSLDSTPGSNAASSKAASPKSAADSASKDDKMTGILTLEFPPSANNQKAFSEAAKSLMESVSNIYKGYEVKYASLPTGFLENDKLDINLDEADVPKTVTSNGAPPEAKLAIKGLAHIKPAVEEAQSPAASAPLTPPPAKPQTGQ